MLRREDIKASITILSNDDASPVDRPNLSKDYLAGSAPEDWVPLRDASFYSEHDIDLRLNANVARHRRSLARIVLADGARSLSTGFCSRPAPSRCGPPSLARPAACLSAALARRLQRHHRTREDGARAVVLGASFIGLEVAAALRARDIEVHVVAPEKNRWSEFWARDWATSSAHSMRSTASSFILRTRRAPSRAAGKAQSGGSARGRSRGRRDRRASAGRARRSGRAQRSTEASWWTPISKRARREYLPPATLLVGPILTAARPFVSSIGSWPSAKDRPQPSTCSAYGRNLRRFRSSGASTTISHQLCRPCREMGRARCRGRHCRQGLSAAVQSAGRTLAVASIFRDVEGLEAEVSLERDATR